MQLGICFERAWENFKRYPAAFVLGTLAIIVANSVLSYAARYLSVIGLLNWLVSTLLGAGLVVMAVKATRGEPIDVPDVFSGFQRPVPFIVVNLAIMAGVIACGVGVFVTAFLFLFSTTLVARGADFGDALKRSKDIALANAGETIVLFLAGVGLALGGTLACGVGLLVTAPLACLVIVEGLDQLERKPVAPATPTFP